MRGKSIRFRFQVRNGEVFSFWVSNKEDGRSNGYIAGGGPGYHGFTDTVGNAAYQAAPGR